MKTVERGGYKAQAVEGGVLGRVAVDTRHRTTLGRGGLAD